MKRYLGAPQDRFVAKASLDRWEDLVTHNAAFMSANNAIARIVFAQIAVSHIMAAAKHWDGPVHFITLVPKACTFEVGDGRPVWGRELNLKWRRQGPAANFNIHVLQQMARQALGSIPFVGMVEASLWRLYRKDQPRRFNQRISWHCHLIVWGASRADIEDRLKAFRKQHTAMVDDMSPAHIKLVHEADLERQTFYMLKAPQKVSEYKFRANPWTSRATGITRPPGWGTQKDWLSTGDRVRMLDIVGDRKLDKLLFGNGAGTDIVHVVRHEALAVHERWIREDMRRNPRHYH